MPADYQRILRAVEGKGGQPVMTREVCEVLSMGVQPQQTEPMRGKLKRLADRGWLHRTPSGRYSLR
jgi:predicted transcriptional regulator of viral defense system